MNGMINPIDVATTIQYADEVVGHKLRGEAVRYLIETCHGLARQGGWWTDLATGEDKQRDPIQLLMLCCSEVAEAMEGDRKSKMDDHLPHRAMREVELADCAIRLCDMAGGLGITEEVVACATEIGEISMNNAADIPFYQALYLLNSTLASYDPQPDTLEFNVVEMVNIVTASIIACFAIGEKFGLDVPGAFAEKLEYNRNREDHRLSHRKETGGKAY